MRTLVAYATRHGSTQGIAVRIGQTLQAAGVDVTVRPISQVRDVGEYDAFVIGGAAYMGRWMGEATEFVREHKLPLATHPVWLFSSGPTGSEPNEEKRQGVLKAMRPYEFDELTTLVTPVDVKVFYGAYDPDQKPVGFAEGFLARLEKVIPAVREGVPAGDFRDWPEIEAWAEAIAHALVAEKVPSPA